LKIENMKVFLGQFVFLSKNEDFEGWMQILVVVIMAVVYGLGSILKAAKSRKLEGKEGQEQDEEPFDHAQDRQPRPAGPAARWQYQEVNQLQRPETAWAKPVVQKPMQTKQSVLTVPEEPQLKPLQARIQELPDTKPEIEKLPEFISETVKGLEYKRSGVTVPAEAAETTYHGKPLFDVSDPEAIRRAILHYEIFGKPLSLRDYR